MARPVVCLLLLLQAIAVVAAGWNFPFGDKAGKKTGDEHDATKPGIGVGDDWSQQNYAERNFYRAAQILRAAPEAPHHRPAKSSGLVALALQYIIKALPSGPATTPSQKPAQATLSRPVAEAVELLEMAAAANNSDALYTLAEMNFFGHYNHPRNLRAAYDLYDRLASQHGNATAQYMLGIYHSTGVGDVVPQDQAKALLYHTFAAAGGDLRSEMAVGYRHFAGVGAIKSCTAAVEHYKRVADKAVEWFRSGPPGGRSWVHQGWRISDDDGGVFGEGASASSAGVNAFKPNLNSDANAAISDVIEYLDLMAQKGDFKAAFNLGRLHYEGQRGLERNLDVAKKYFFSVASRYWRRDGRLVDNYKAGIEKTACKAAAYLGRLYLRGEGLNQNFDKARTWFERGVSKGDAQAQYGLGLMLLHGYGGKQNVRKAAALFKVAADQDYAPAQVEMGKLHLDAGSADDVRIANNYFELAARYGNIEAHYFLAEMVHYGVGRESLCAIALNYYKNVAEKAEPLVSSWAEANDAYESGDVDAAFLYYLLAAEQGYERAQTNVAYMLDSQKSGLPLADVIERAKQLAGTSTASGNQASSSRSSGEDDDLLDNPRMALIHWTRSSRQSNVDSMVKMGDYYYYGVGTERDVSKAVQCYLSASDHSQSAQALFNLGWMHENGVGLTQDFHLAKRYYDHALVVNKEAYLPVTLSLMKLRLRSAWNTLTHGDIHGIQEEPNVKKDWSLSEWIANFIKDDGYYDYEDDVYLDDLYDDTIGGGGNEGDLDEGGLVESLLIIGVMGALVFLLWWRQRIQQAHAQRHEEQQRQQQQMHNEQYQQQQQQAQQAQQAQQQAQQGDVRPDDPFPGWAAGGLGI